MPVGVTHERLPCGRQAHAARMTLEQRRLPFYVFGLERRDPAGETADWV